MTGMLARYSGQAILYAVFLAIIGTFSSYPPYVRLSENSAEIKLSLSHAGAIIGECRALNEQERAQLPPNMRVTEICPRERSPVTLQLILDNKSLYQDVLHPSGLKRDGSSATYQKFVVPSGRHTLQVRMNDDQSKQGYTHTFEQQINLAPRQVMVVNYRPDSRGFTLQ
jgi:hypothetical protein